MYCPFHGTMLAGNVPQIPNTHLPCAVCSVLNSRECSCGALLAHSLDEQALTSFVSFVRSPHTPILHDVDPWDQQEFKECFRSICTTPSDDVAPRKRGLGCDVVTREQLLHFIVRAAAVGALSGRQDILKILPCTAKDEEFLSALGTITKPEVQFFRGGQCHGQLTKAAVCKTTEAFLGSLSTEIEEAILDIGKWEEAAERCRLAGDFFAKVKVAGTHFGAKNYWSKRFVELIILASSAWQECVGTPLVDLRPSDVDGAASAWPVGPGTESAARLIFSAVKSHQDVREVIRVLQRVLGGGKRRIPFITISAMLCFWQRNENATLNWRKPALEECSAPLKGHGMTYSLRRQLPIS